MACSGSSQEVPFRLTTAKGLAVTRRNVSGKTQASPGTTWKCLYVSLDVTVIQSTSTGCTNQSLLNKCGQLHSSDGALPHYEAGVEQHRTLAFLESLACIRTFFLFGLLWVLFLKLYFVVVFTTFRVNFAADF